VNVLLTVLAVSLLILVHELGHFIAAKLVGMRVEVFSIGFWKKLLAVRVGETEYRLSLVPLGGYVRVTGESPQEGKGKPHEFWSKTPGQRAVFIVGGVAMNLVLALALFIVAFAIGVPFTVGEVGETRKGESAWEVGLKPGDRIVKVDDIEDPTFIELTRVVALSSRDRVRLEVERAGRILPFTLEPRYDPEFGLKLVGIVPPFEPVVSGLAKIGGEDGVSPAKDAGIEIDDRILAIDGTRVETAYELTSELANYPHDELGLLVERDGETFAVRLVTEPVPLRLIGIQGVGTTIESLEGDGPAERMGLKVGDRIAAVNGVPVESQVEVEKAARAALGDVAVGLLRGGDELTLQAAIPDLKALERFFASVLFESSTTLTYVEEGGPAWSVGMRPGDRVVSGAGNRVETWEEVLVEGAKVAGKEHEIQWARGEETIAALVTPVENTDLSPGHLGIILAKDKTAPERYGALGAVYKGFANTFRTFSEIVLMLRGFATRQVSPRNMGGILTIAVASYHAAREGIGKLLYLTAVISAAIALLNILPIPVLDGGHLLFIALEKLRGRRLGERALTIAQTVGFVLLVLLVVYVTRNDIARLLQLR
jgi:regulator of sigma E protease